MEYSVDQRIAFGGDSCVYRIRDCAEKVYNGGPLCAPVPPKQVNLYAGVTNEAAKLAESLNLRANVGEKDYSVEVNPVVDTKEEDGLAVTVSPLVEGVPLNKAVDLSLASDSMHKLSQKLNELLRVEGIEITPGNAMLCGGKIVVTDLCASVRKLKRKLE